MTDSPNHPFTHQSNCKVCPTIFQAPVDVMMIKTQLIISLLAFVAVATSNPHISMAYNSQHLFLAQITCRLQVRGGWVLLGWVSPRSGTQPKGRPLTDVLQEAKPSHPVPSDPAAPWWSSCAVWMATLPTGRTGRTGIYKPLRKGNP